MLLEPQLKGTECQYFHKKYIENLKTLPLDDIIISKVIITEILKLFCNLAELLTKFLARFCKYVSFNMDLLLCPGAVLL